MSKTKDYLAQAIDEIVSIMIERGISTSAYDDTISEMIRDELSFREVNNVSLKGKLIAMFPKFMDVKYKINPVDKFTLVILNTDNNEELIFTYIGTNLKYTWTLQTVSKYLNGGYKNE